MAAATAQLASFETGHSDAVSSPAVLSMCLNALRMFGALFESCSTLCAVEHVCRQHKPQQLPQGAATHPTPHPGMQAHTCPPHVRQGLVTTSLLPSSCQVHDASFDYYGKRLATASSDRCVKVFDVTGDQVRCCCRSAIAAAAAATALAHLP